MFAENIGNNLLKKIPGCENMFIAPNGEIRVRGNFSGRQARYKNSSEHPQTQQWAQNGSHIVNTQFSQASRPQFTGNTNQHFLQQQQPHHPNFYYGPPPYYQGYHGSMQAPPPTAIPIPFALQPPSLIIFRELHHRTFLVG